LPVGGARHHGPLPRAAKTLAPPLPSDTTSLNVELVTVLEEAQKYWLVNETTM